MIKDFKNWKSLNEYGWDSIDDDAGDISINGVSLDLTIVYVYDTPNAIAMGVYVKPTPEELLEIGVFSAGYVGVEEDDRGIRIYENGEELSDKRMERLGVSSVRDLNDSDIYGMYGKNYKASVPDPMTREKFIKIVKEYDWNTDDQGLSDIVAVPDGEKETYKKILRATELSMKRR